MNDRRRYRIRIASLALAVFSAVSGAVLIVPMYFGVYWGEDLLWRPAERVLLGLWWWSFYLAALVALVLGIIGLRKGGRRHAFAVVGTALSVVLIGLYAADLIYAG